jgi:hypothetical protein
MEKYKNLNAATAATSAQLNAITQTKIAQAAAQNPTFKAQADILLGALKNQQLAQQSELAMHQAGLNLAQGNGQGVNLEMLPPEMRARAVQLPTGEVALAPTPEDAKGVKDSLTSLSSINSQLDDIENDMKTQGRTINPYGTRAEDAASKKANLVLELNKLHGLSRLNDNEYNSYVQHAPDPGALNQSKVAAQIQNFRALVKNKMQQELSNHLEGYRPNPIKPKAGFQ